MRPPNVVLCVGDQLRAFEAGCYGNKVVRTPHIDRLAAAGHRHRHRQQQFMVDGAAPVAVDGYSVEREIEAVDRFLARSADSDEPFFLYYNIMPMILQACGVALPEGLQGQSLLSLLAGEGRALERSWSFVETSGSSVSRDLTEIGIRTPSHLYGIGLDAQSHELVEPDLCFHDLDADPYEFDNVVASGHAPEVEGELKRRLLDWNEQTPWLTDPDGGPDRTHLFDGDGMPLQKYGGN